MKILFNTWPEAFDCPGGGEIQLLNYETELKSMGHSIYRYNPWSPQFNQVDLVHYFSVMSGTWNFPWYVKNVKRLPLVVSPIIWIDSPEKYDMVDIRRILDNADLILPNSYAEVRNIQEHFDVDESKFRVIVNGVSSVFFETVDGMYFRERFRLYDPFVLCMGNIEPRKNQLSLIQATEKMGIKLVLIGEIRDIEYAKRCKQVASDNVLFLPKLDHGSILQRSAYSACNLFVLPSTLETPGLAALEAAVSGAKVAITSIGSAKDYFGEYATYLNPYDIQSIREACYLALEKPKEVKLADMIKTKFSWQVAALQLERAYSELL